MSPKKELRISENFSVRPGIQFQFWTEALQDRVRKPNGDAGDYQRNAYMRRTRVFLWGSLFKKASYFITLEALNLGRTSTAADGAATKNLAPVIVQDAFISLNLVPEFSIYVGLVLVPFSRQTAAGTVALISLDALTTTTTVAAATQTSALRDTGVLLKGTFAQRLEYRVAVLQGIRQSSEQMGAQGGKNSLRFSGYLQYSLLDPEPGYFFDSQHFGHKNILGVGVGFDTQKLDGADAYWATSATAYSSLRLNGNAEAGGDSLDTLVQFLHFEPGTSLPAGVGRQNDIAAELGYYSRALSASVFGKYEQRIHSQSQFEGADLRIFGGGVKYFFAKERGGRPGSANCNVALAYNRNEAPNADPTTSNSANQFIVALQGFYF